jgi:hypothetical protein
MGRGPHSKRRCWKASRHGSLSPPAVACRVGAGVLPIGARAQVPVGGAGLQAAVGRFAALPAASCLIVADQPGNSWQASSRAHASSSAARSRPSSWRVFATWRGPGHGRQADGDKRLGEVAQQPGVPRADRHGAGSERAPTATTPRPTGAVGADRVLGLIAQTGLKSTQIPQSTRRLFSYLAGEPEGEDVGWPPRRALCLPLAPMPSSVSVKNVMPAAD